MNSITLRKIWHRDAFRIGIFFERDIEEALRIKTRYEQTIKTLNFELNAWDKFSSENKT